MRTLRWALAAAAVALLVALVPDAALRVAAMPALQAPAAPRDYPPDAREPRLRRLRMLTDGGENAEAYFSFDGQRLIFQSSRPGAECDQIFTMNADGTG
ncbi:MAG: hypothetical protein EHM24_30915, partial [Acidobacteria bacterium]